MGGAISMVESDTLVGALLAFVKQIEGLEYPVNSATIVVKLDNGECVGVGNNSIERDIGASEHNLTKNVAIFYHVEI